MIGKGLPRILKNLALKLNNEGITYYQDSSTILLTDRKYHGNVISITNSKASLQNQAERLLSLRCQLIKQRTNF